MLGLAEQETPDEGLIARYLESGEREALDCLVRRHVGKVRSAIFAMVLNDADADDLTQEVLVRAVRGLGGMRDNRSFSAWLCSIAMNTTRSFLRSKARQRAFDEKNGVEEAVAPACGTPVRLREGAELGDAIEAGLESLSPTLRAAIVLTAIHGLEPREAASVEGCATATIYWRIHQAKKALKERLKEHLET